MLDIQNPNTFLGGQNVHNVVLIALGVTSVVLLVKILKK